MKQKSRVFVTGSLWSLLIYLVANDLDCIKRTWYFFTDKGIHQSVRANFRHHVINISWDDKVNWSVVQLCYIFIPFINIIRWPYLLYSEIWGIDQGFGIQSIIGRRSYTLIEDGAADYCVSRVPVYNKLDWIRKLLWGDIYCHDFGRNSKCKKIILTQPFHDEHLKNKVESIDLSRLWHQSSKEKQTYILNCFNLTHREVELMASKKVIVLTQPFSKDCDISDEEQVEMYRNMIVPYGESNVIIKPHPRETLPYRHFMPNVLVMDKAIPFQLFTLLGIQFDTVVTVSSTAAMSIKNEHTLIDFKGTIIDKRISDVYGIITKDLLTK